VPAGRLARKPEGLAWEAASVQSAVGATAYAAVRAVGVGAGDTIADGEAARLYGTRTDAQEQADTPEVWEQLAALASGGQLVIPIQSVYPLERVRDAYDELAARHTRGKIVLRVGSERRSSG